MRCAAKKTLATIAIAATCSCTSRPPYEQPPVGSYAVGTHEVKIGDVHGLVKSAAVSSEFFRAAAVRPLLGRFFLDADASSPQPVVVLSHDLWKERLASSPSVIGQAIDVDGKQAIVVGVAPSDFRIPDGAQLWIPAAQGAVER